MKTSPNNPAPQAPDPLAVALSKLDPTPHGFDWNALMFAAGRESKLRALTFWRTAACVCALAACGLAVTLFTRPVKERVVYQKVTVPAAPAAPQAQRQPLPLPVPVGAPVAQPEPKSESPAVPSASESLGWSFDPPPEQGAATRWLTLRNEVLTVGLSVLPDDGRKVPPPAGHP